MPPNDLPPAVALSTAPFHSQTLSPGCPQPRRCDPVGPLLGLASAGAPPSRVQVLRLLKPEFDSSGLSASC